MLWHGGCKDVFQVAIVAQSRGPAPQNSVFQRGVNIMAASKITHLLSALALAAVILPVGAIAAQPDSETNIVLVSTAGLNAARPADQAVLRHRIAVAAHKVCDAVTQGDALTTPGYVECVGKASADATSQLEGRIVAADATSLVAAR